LNDDAPAPPPDAGAACRGRRYGDYFTDSYRHIFERDLALFTEMGANTVRLYAWRQSVRHTRFLDAALARNLAVVAVYEMGTSDDSPVTTGQQRALLRARLQARLRVSKHPAIVAWLVGNELNGAWQGFTCNDEYAELYLYHPCLFGDSAARLCALVDSLCEVVHAETGTLCSTPFAGVNPPLKYIYPLTVPATTDPSRLITSWGYGLHGWAEVCEARRRSPDEDSYGGVQHVDFWAANLYPGRSFHYFNLTRCPERPRNAQPTRRLHPPPLRTYHTPSTNRDPTTLSRCPLRTTLRTVRCSRRATGTARSRRCHSWSPSLASTRTTPTAATRTASASTSGAKTRRRRRSG
jgi:hypothetical protein